MSEFVEVFPSENQPLHSNEIRLAGPFGVDREFTITGFNFNTLFRSKDSCAVGKVCYEGIHDRKFYLRIA